MTKEDSSAPISFSTGCFHENALPVRKRGLEHHLDAITRYTRPAITEGNRIFAATTGSERTQGRQIQHNMYSREGSSTINAPMLLTAVANQSVP